MNGLPVVTHGERLEAEHSLQLDEMFAPSLFPPLPHDNAVAESFFQLLKRERIKRTIYKTRGHARQDIFDYIEMFYNPIRRHSHAANLSPVNYEQQYFIEATNCL